MSEDLTRVHAPNLTPDEVEDALYPHQTGDGTVTTEQLREHRDKNPDLYPGALGEAAAKLLTALPTETQTEQPPTEAELTIENIIDILEKNVEGKLSIVDAHKLIDAGKGEALVLHLDRFTGLDHNEIAHKLIDAGKGEALAYNLWEFTGLDVSVAHKLIDAGQGETVAYFLSIFTGLDHNEIAHKLIDAGKGEVVVQYLWSFTDLDHNEIAHKLIDAGKGEGLVQYLRAFTDLDHNEIAHKLIDAGQGEVVAYNLWRFTGLDASVAHKLIGAGKGEVVVQYLRAFTDLDHNEIAHKLIDAGQGEVVVQYLNRFKNLHLSGDVLREFLQFKDLDVHNIIHCFHIFGDIDDETLDLIRERSQRDWLTEYPCDHQNPQSKDRWFGDMSYTYMDGGFNKATIGRVIRLRYEQGIEPDIHDASQWLSEFRIPNRAYDTRKITHDISRNDFNPDAYMSEQLHDEAVEYDFFASMFAAYPELLGRLNLSLKPGMSQQLFYTPELQLLYEAMNSHGDGDTVLYKKEGFNEDVLIDQANDMVATFASTSFGQEKNETTHGISADDLRNRLVSLRGMFTTPQGHKISELVQDLKAMGARRLDYIQDTQAWLVRHATSPSGRLTKVWSDRAIALLDGTPDNARAIEVWQSINAIRQTVLNLEENGSLADVYNLTKDEVIGVSAQSTVGELARVLSASNTIKALSKLKNWREKRDWTNKLLPAESISVSLEDVPVSATKPYRLEVFSADDPRGFTIGEDTGCCMTIEGAAKSCLKTGYKRRDAGFIGMYTPEGNLAAQSFWYVNPIQPEVLVLDNIEANEGRDMGKVLEVYKKALTAYLTQHPELHISRVNVGTGYTDVNLWDLKKTGAVPSFSGVYSDAEEQRELLHLP